MAEAVGAVASVAQLVQISGTLLAGGYTFLSKVARAPSEIRSLLTETAAINSLLGQLQAIADSGPNSSPDDALQALERLGVFQECQTTLKAIQKALATCEHLNGKDVKNFSRRLLWPFKEKETKDALQRLHHLRSLLANALEANSASALRRIEEKQTFLMGELTFLSDNAKAQISQEETRNIVNWLCPLPSDGARNSLDNALKIRLPGTGKWFLDSDAYQSWINSKAGTIWITGLPGIGKTTLCASIIENLQQLNHSNNIAVLYFFCDHRDRSKMTHESFSMNITKQILDSSPACLERAKELYEEKDKKLGRTSDQMDHIGLMVTFLAKFDQVFIVVDGLDEASEGYQIADALVHLYESSVQKHIPTRVLFSSRFDVRIERRYSSITATRIALAENMEQDIEHFARWELERRVNEGVIKLRDKGFMGIILDRIKLRAGTLLQARLQLDYLSTAKTDREIKAMLLNLPNGLEYTYDTLLCSMASQYPVRKDEMKILLQCLATATSPMSASQLSEIMAMQPGERYLDFDAVNTDPYDTLETIAPFVIIDRQNKGHGFVKLSHYSLQEYLCSERIRRGPAAFFYVDLNEADAWFTKVCLQYLSFSAFDLPLDQFPVEPSLEMRTNYAFWRYAALNWFKHMHGARGLAGFKDRYEPYLSWFVDGGEGTPCYRRWLQIFSEAFPFREARFHSPICFAIWAELDELVEHLLLMLPNVDYRFADGFTCLTVAAMRNRTAVTRELLDLGASVDLALTNGNRQLTPLHLAAEFACQETFDLLLDAGADPHARSASGTTPFYRACRGGSLHILRRLKDCGSDVNARTWDNWTPLFEAVENGHDEVACLLLEWGADPGIVTDYGMTAMSLAEELPYYSIVEILQKAVFGKDKVAPEEEEKAFDSLEESPAGEAGRA